MIDTLTPDTRNTIPTVTDNLFTQGAFLLICRLIQAKTRDDAFIGAISAREVSVSFEPTTSLADVNGELTFGGTDSSKFTGSITFAYVCEL